MIITLAEQLGAIVVAEGVESADQLTWLFDNNCTQAQGYFVARPMPAEEFLELIKSGKPLI